MNHFLHSEDIQISNIGSYQGDSEVDIDCQVDNLKYYIISQSSILINKQTFCFKDFQYFYGPTLNRKGS